ncbi:DNA repair family protein [Taphrina deformans PYCC 5710]|uniref:DNA repair family protein n=1 Tax=Taphrina deformans (strain PYCC 5710 / ATCC 11124 / CBS 356.35 / IMI 108563 / JCM 9778 / NBRC 8474) TaxID=1097556 RepID=R4X6W8_TAPDE|nr:DNA repair family protein [Taphrina deformans PYCC 5710]|eukprot:CCG80716.1 DNA repair family protein [Taphrina deformans PYCC 5710]
MSKRSSIEAFFTPSTAVKRKKAEDSGLSDVAYDKHTSYPIPLPSRFPFELTTNPQYKSITNQPDLDLTYHQPLFPASVAKDLYHFLRDEFCWYRVTYEVRGMTINTPRYTTVFGLDDTHVFTTPTFPNCRVHEKGTDRPPRKTLRCVPRPLPGCLTQLRTVIEGVTGARYNFCLLNYYKDGTDSISYHSDDESFLGPDPTIASLSLGCPRDFLMRNKADHGAGWRTTLRSGDMVVMKGTTQAKWDHAVPKRPKTSTTGRINITFRRALVPAGTENYYRYNVHHGPYFRWDPAQATMVLGTSLVLPGPVVVSPAAARPEESFDPDASIRAIDAANPGSRTPVAVPGLAKEESDDLSAQIRAIDEAVARANGSSSS